MRFNDLLRTVLAHDGEGTASAVTRWRQCIDLVAQYDVSGANPAHQLQDEDAAAVFEVLHALRDILPPDQRVAPIVELGNRLRSIQLCRFLAQDHPAIVTAVMVRARLVDEHWAAIIPALGPLARSLLRRRDDLGPAARAVLERFGPSDLALPSTGASAHRFQAANDVAPPGPPTSPTGALEAEALPVTSDDDSGEIRRIVERIERFTASRDGLAEARPLELALDQAIPSAEADGDAFSFVTDDKGRFIDAQGAPRCAVLGLTVGQAGLDSLSGADGQALGAFRRRAAFRDARFAIADGILTGQWRISGEPQFDRASGLFRGYAGSARRELGHEQMVQSSGDAAGWSGFSAAETRQLIHELRTPLSAIYAYAEMIEGQLVGPVSSDYRDLARKILADARDLVATFDDLDLAGRIARDEDAETVDMVDVVAQLRAIVQRLAQAGSQRIMLETVPALPPVKGVREQMERMLTHLVRTGYAALAPDEPLIVRLRHLPVTGSLSVIVQRPIALCGFDETSLLDHGSSVDQALNEAPPLGLAFALRLVRGIASRAGGKLLISDSAFELVLPCAAQVDAEQEGRP